MMIKLEPGSKFMEHAGQDRTDAAGDDVPQMQKKGAYTRAAGSSLGKRTTPTTHSETLSIFVCLADSKLSLWPAVVAKSDQTV